MMKNVSARWWNAELRLWLVRKMSSQAGARCLTAHNMSHGGQGGYQTGQKIAIKTNMNGSVAYGDDQRRKTRERYTNPVLLRVLLLSLVEDAGGGAEFLMNEPAVTERNGALWGTSDVENYLHGAALAASASSGMVYYNGNEE